MLDLFGLTAMLGASAASSSASSSLGSALGAATSSSLSGLDNLIGAAIGSESAASLAPSVAMGIDGTKSALVLTAGALVVGGGSLWAGHAWGRRSALADYGNACAGADGYSVSPTSPLSAAVLGENLLKKEQQAADTKKKAAGGKLPPANYAFSGVKATVAAGSDNTEIAALRAEIEALKAKSGSGNEFLNMLKSFAPLIKAKMEAEMAATTASAPEPEKS